MWTDFGRPIAHPEACPTCGDDPIYIALIAQPEDDCADADFIVRDDLEVDAHISCLGEETLEHRAGPIGRRVEGSGIAHCRGTFSILLWCLCLALRWFAPVRIATRAPDMMVVGSNGKG